MIILPVEGPAEDSTVDVVVGIVWVISFTGAVGATVIGLASALSAAKKQLP